MEIVDKIREQNRKRANRYYDKHRTLISERRKAKRANVEPPKKDDIVEEPYSKSLINKLNDQIAIIEQEINDLKTKSFTTGETIKKIILPENIDYSLDEVKQVIKDNVVNPKSQKTYINNVKNLFDILGSENIFKSLKNYKNVIYKIKTVGTIKDPNKVYSKNSQKQIFQSILKIITLYSMSLSDNAIDAYKHEFEILKVESSQQQEKKKSEIELLNYDDYMKQVEDKFGKDSRQYLTIAMYKVNTFRDDLGELLIVDKPPKILNNEQNYLVVPELKTKNISILLNAYKTVAKYGKETININKEYSKLIRNYIETNKLEYNDFLFNSKTLSKYISNFNKELGLKGYTINTLRKMKVSTGLADANGDAAKILQIAKDAHHHVNTGKNVYNHSLIK
jgi:hypothetical protein